MTYPVIETTSASTATITSSGFNIDALPKRCTNLGMQVIANDLDQADATVKIQHSADDVNYEDIVGGSITLAAGDSAQVLTPVVDLGMSFYRAVYDNGTVAAGDVKVIFSFN
jgi:hypothetical protein